MTKKTAKRRIMIETVAEGGLTRKDRWEMRGNKRVRLLNRTYIGELVALDPPEPIKLRPKAKYD